MHKVIKISGKILLSAILFVLLAPLVLSLLLAVPAIQNFAVDRAARMLSRRLETTVAVGRVDVRFAGRIRLEDLYVEDYQKDTLLYAHRLDAFLPRLGLNGSGLRFTEASLEGAKVFLRETPSGEMNIRQLVARLTNPDKPKKGGFRLSIGEVAVRDLELRIERLRHRNPAYGIDYGDMRFEACAARLNDFAIDGPRISADIEHLSLREQSGFELRDLAALFDLRNGRIALEAARLQLPHSDLSVPQLVLEGGSWADYKRFVSAVDVIVVVDGGTLSTTDLAWFVPALRHRNAEFGRLDLDFKGTVADFDLAIRRLTTPGGASLRASGRVRGLPDKQRARFDVRIAALRSDAREALRLASELGGVQLPAATRTMLLRTGRLDLSGRFEGSLARFESQLGLSTSLGTADGTVRLEPIPDRPALRRIEAQLTSRRFRVGALLDREPQLGSVTVQAYLNGTVGGEATRTRFRCDLTQLGFNDYVYDTIRFDGRLLHRRFDGRIFVRDPNLQSRLTGLIDWRDSVPRYDVTVTLDRVDLHRLHFNRRDTLSQFSGRIIAKASGRSLDDLNGRIRLTDAEYRYDDRTIRADNLVIEGENSADRKYVALRSPFADVTFRSRTGYAQIFDYLRRSAWRYLPLIDRGQWLAEDLPTRSSVADDFSILDVELRNITPIADAVANGLQVADGSSLKLMFNPASDRLSLNVSSEYVERRNMLATRLRINASNLRDSLTFYASAEDFYVGLFRLPQFSVTGGARRGRVQLTTGFNDTLRKTSARIGLRAGVAAEGPDGRVIELDLLPSHYTSGPTTWQLGARGIRIDSTRIRIDRFLMRNADQRLLADGVLSRDERDSLTLQLRDFSIAPLTRIAEGMGYRIDGRLNGTATMTGMPGSGRVTADLRLDSLAANGLAAPPLHLVSGWDFARKRAGLVVTAAPRSDTLLVGFYAPDRKLYRARLTVDSLDMALLDPVLAGIVSETEGTAAARIELRGEGPQATLSGSVRVRDFATTVDYTKVRYSMPEAELKLADSRFTARDVPVFDPEGNRGTFALDLDLRHLSDIAYDVRLRPDEMLVLHTTAADNELFYGRIYASGEARIKGRKGETDMRINAATDDHSLFFLPLSDKSNLSTAEFVTFVAPPDADSLDRVAQRRRLFEQRKQKRARAANRMKIDLTLDVRPNLEAEIMISGSPIRARGEGLLNLVIDPKGNGLEMFGDYRITEGSYHFSLQNLLSKKFVIRDGSTIQWTGAPADARLNIEAVYKLKTSLQPLLEGAGGAAGADRSVPVECIIRLDDRLTNPTISFDVRVPEADPETQAIIATVLNTPEAIDLQFLYLLLLNNFMAENNNAANSNFGASASAATGLEFLTNQLSRLISDNLVIRYRPKTELAGDELDFGLSQSLIDNRLYVEVEGNYLLDNKQAVNSSMSNFMGEAYVTYLIDRSGSLKLKAFTQTIDRFDENQGLQETGVGIYYKEDFDNLRDLLRRVKERFKRKERKQKKAKRNDKLK